MDTDFATVELNEVFDDGEAETCATLFATAGGIDAEESFKNAFLDIQGDDGAEVMNVDIDEV